MMKCVQVCDNTIQIEDGEWFYLQSYQTMVLKMEKTSKRLVRMWDGYSATTLRQVNRWLAIHGVDLNVNKAKWDNMELEVE